MNLHELGLPTSERIKNNSANGVTQDSRQVETGFVFFAIESIRGLTQDGHEHIQTALDAGASAVVAKKGHPLAAKFSNEPRLILVDDPRKSLGIAASRFYGDPSDHMQICGVTGTNGKTTSTYLLEAILAQAELKPCVIGTVENRFGSHTQATEFTTPNAVELQKILAEFFKQGARSAAIEVSSHGLDQLRTWGTRFAGVLFTNLTQDHLDYHPSMQDYFDTKLKLFTDYETQARAIHTEFEYGKKLDALCRNKNLQTLTFASEGANVNYKNLISTAQGISGELEIDIEGQKRKLSIRSNLLGAFNVQNIAGATTLAIALGVPDAVITKGLLNCKQVPGRVERVQNRKGLTVLVDYAHTPDALEKALATLKPLCRGKLVCVFGCGGDRDSTKRPLMAAVAEKWADSLYVTSDNPRTEDPEKILDQIFTGFKNTSKPKRVVDRNIAIGQAIQTLSPNDILLIAGKGHETYQIIGTTKLPFDDRAVALGHLNNEQS